MEQEEPAPGPATPGPEDGARCRQCRRAIPTGAARCYQCGAYQNWRRFLSLSTTVLALLISLVSVTGLVLPAVVRALEEETADVSARLLDVEEASDGESLVLSLAVTNSGTRAGIVRAARLEISGLGTVPRVLDFGIRDWSSGDALAEPGRTYVLALHCTSWDMIDKGLVEAGLGTATFRLTLESVDEGVSNQVSVDCEDHVLRDFVAGELVWE